MPSENEQAIPPPSANAFRGSVILDHDIQLQVSGPDDIDAGETRRSAAADHSPVGLKMIERAQTQIDVCETGQNGGLPLTRYTRAFWPDSGPQPWCAFFVSWCYLKESGRQPPWDNAGLVRSVRDWASRNSRLVRVPLRGDMFGVGVEHMGLVARSLQGRIITIEGNTSSGCVRAVERNPAGLWFARPR